MRSARLLLVACIALARTARADVAVDVNLNARGQAIASSMGITPAELAARIKSRIDEIYRTAQVDTYLASFSDSTAFSARGLGVDYVSLPRSLIVGFAGTATLAANDQIAGDNLLARGVSANFAVMAGLNLSEWGHPRITLYANGFYRDASTSELDGSIASGGAHVQVKAVEAAPSRTALRWIGVDVTTGLEVTRSTFGSTMPIATNFNVAGGGRTESLTLDTMGHFGLTSTAGTIPIEVSTGLRIATFFDVYVGGGLDFGVASSSLDANMTGPLSTSDGAPAGTVSISGTGDHTGGTVGVRALAGAQLELSKFKLFVQANAAPSVASVGAGFRIVL